MMHHKRWLATAVAALGLTTSTITGTGCDADKPADPGPTNAHGPLYAMTRALRIGVKADQPGIGFVNPAGSKYTGLDIDIAHEIAKALHAKPVFQPVVSGNREEMLLSGAVDLVIASYSISEERLQKIDFAGPYFIAGQDILIRAGDTTITNVNSLKSKVTCGSTGSSSPRRLAIKFGDTEDVNNAWAAQHLKLVDGYGDCLPLLLKKTVDAVSTDDSILAGFAHDPRYRSRVRLLGERFSSHREKYGIGIVKGNPADTALINTALAQMIKDGRWEQIIRKNLGDAAPLFLKPENRPSPPTT